MTNGEWKVGLDFNPSGNALVADLKMKAAAFIDAVALVPKPEGDEKLTAEIGRLKALAMTHAEDAAMWAVKAATKRAQA